MKAILVIDVPVLDDGRHLCNGCPIWNDEHCFCQYDFNMGAKGCPLKPMPEKKEHYSEDIWYEEDYTFGYIDGWNDCIDEIIGKDCRDCTHWETCVNGKEGHEKGTSLGYSIGECQYFVGKDAEGGKFQ